MHSAPRRRVTGRTVVLDRMLERLPLFRLSDSADAAAISLATEAGGRWRVLPSPGDRLPGTFDQDVYVELLRRYLEAGSPADGGLTFTLHAFLCSLIEGEPQAIEASQIVWVRLEQLSDYPMGKVDRMISDQLSKKF